MVIDAVGVGASLVLGGLAGLHVFWAFRGRGAGAAAVPTVDGRPVFTPSKAATLVVAFLLAVSALLVLGRVGGWDPQLLFAVGCGGVAVVLLARAIGDRRYVGLLKQVQDTDFARRDTCIYAPLCLVLGVAVAATAVLG